MLKNLTNFQLGEAVEHRVVVAPLFPTRDPACVRHARRGAPARARDHRDRRGGTSPSSRSTTRSTEKVLLYDGEELVGAKQNRILNVTVLVAEQTGVRIPVSCVEQGRWATRSIAMDAAGHVSHAHLRRRKAEMLAATPLARGIAQGEV